MDKTGARGASVPRVIAIVQARMASNRLPGKVIMDIAGRSMLWHVVSRVRQANLVEKVVVGTSDLASDDPVAAICDTEDILCFRGSEIDVLDRFYQVASNYGANAIVRISADCPLIDPEIIDKVVRVYQDGDYDYVTNTFPCSYPDGMDTEIFTFSALEQAWREATWHSEREHVTPYLRKHRELFDIGNVCHETDLSDMRWTVDEMRDLEFVKSVHRHMTNTDFGMTDILELLSRHPEIVEINAGVDRNEGYQRSLREDTLFAFEEK